ncbi:MAG: hypothetical protein BBJ60_03530 [Desulfobacterales bacterium S7086C20]|nr:MAG: hypothetical protein BBJ60_03530 [Desulfobacterales bacterium S7086C20]
MAAYLLARVEVTDWDRYKEYTKKTPGAIAKYGGKFIVRAGDMVTLEGPEETRRVVLIEFPSFEKAKEFYYSHEYQEAKKLRAGAATGQFLAIDGVD